MEAEFEILNALKKSQEMITNDSPRVNTNRAIRFDNHTDLVLRILRDTYERRSDHVLKKPSVPAN